jgi:hypothetical protein
VDFALKPSYFSLHRVNLVELKKGSDAIHANNGSEGVRKISAPLAKFL